MPPVQMQRSALTTIPTTLGTTASQISPKNFNRKYLLIANTHASAKIALSFEDSITPVVGAAGCVTLNPGDSLTFDQGFAPSNRIRGISDTVNTGITVWEMTLED